MTSTIKQITENPSKNAVTAPTDPKFKAVDIDRKMALYGVVEALRQGSYPTNEQISNSLNYALSHEPIPTNQLSREGKNLVQDFKEIIKTAEKIIQKKNADELFQNFLYHTRHVDTGKAAGVKDVNLPVGKEERSQDADQAVEHLRTLGKLIFTNSEARKLLKDIGLLGRDVAADAAAKASDMARPSDEKLAAVDEPAPSNEWVGPDGEKRDHTQGAPDTGLAAKKDEALAKADEAKAHGERAANQAAESGNKVANAADGATDENQTDEERTNAAANAGGNKAKAEKDKFLGKLNAKIPDKHKDLAKEHYGKAKDYAKDKFPEERRDRFIYRLKKVVVENQRHRDYQEAIEFFLDRAENYAGAAKDATKAGTGEGLSVREDNDYKIAEHELRTLLERFANNQSMQPIFDAVNQLYKDAKNDDELRSWFNQLDAYARKVLQEPGFIMKDQCDREGRELSDKGKKFWDPKTGKYAGHKDAVFDNITSFFTAYADDELNVQLGEDVKKLTLDLLMDSEGSLKYKPHLWSDVRKVILPTMIKNVGYIPIPRIEYTDNMVDVVIENLTLESQNLLPNILEIEARNYFKVSPYDSIKDQNKHSFWVSFSQIQADLKDVAFYFKKKSGFPKLSDSGLIDVFIGGSGISGKIWVESTGRKDHAFKVKEVKVKIDKMAVDLRNIKHNILIAIFKPLAMGLIKKAVEKAIQEGIRAGLIQLDAQLADISERLDEAKESDDDVSRVDVIKKTFAEKKEKAAAAKDKPDESTGKFQITAQRDSKLVDWSSKNSIIEKQGLKQDATTKQGGWYSKAFDLVGHSSPVKPSSSPSATLHAANGTSTTTSSGAGERLAAGAAGAGAVGAGAAAYGSSHGTHNGGVAASLDPSYGQTEPSPASYGAAGLGSSGTGAGAGAGAGGLVGSADKYATEAKQTYGSGAQTASSTTASAGQDLSSSAPPPVPSF